MAGSGLAGVAEFSADRAGRSAAGSLHDLADTAADRRGNAPAADERMNAQGLEELVADKGYHSGAMVEDGGAIGVRSYIPEPKRKRRHWQGKRGEQAAVYGNRRRLRAKRGRTLLPRRGELLERTFAHVYDTGGMRRRTR
jgi:transposase